MTRNNSLDRIELLKTVAMLKPALATADYIPALTHIRFKNGYATAYNDISAIEVRCLQMEDRCIPGELLLKMLNSVHGDTVAITFDPKTNALLMSSGRSKLKLPTLPVDDFPFDMPTELGPEIALTKEMVSGIERCLLSVGKDAKHPAHMGVTIEAGKDQLAIFHSTDNDSISRFQTQSRITLPGNAPVILPTFFCEQLISLYKTFEKSVVLVMYPGAVLADFNNGEALLFTKKFILDIVPVDIERIFAKFGNPHVAGKWVNIPDAFDGALSRALLVIAGDDDPTTKIDINNECMTLHTVSPMGVSEDNMSIEWGNVPEFLVDPQMVLRASKVCDTMSPQPKVLVFGGGNGRFVHLIAHVMTNPSRK